MTGEPVVPAYGRATLADVLPSLLHAIGAPLDDRPPAFALPASGTTALLLIDGLGHELLRAHAGDAPVLCGLADLGPVTVGFPSSTPISLTSLMTAVPPGTHGSLGVGVRVDDELLDLLSWTVDGRDRRDDLVPETVQPAPSVLDRAERQGVAVRVVSPAEFRGSGFTRSWLGGGEYRPTFALGDLVAEIVAALAGPGPALVYGYHADLDKVGHLYGPGSEPWRWQLRLVDTLVGALLEALPDHASLAITGDHGMVATDRVLDADRDPRLTDGVSLIGGDPRARHLYVRPGARDDVAAAWSSVLGDDAWVVPGEDAVARGWFGPVATALAARVGDVVVAMRGRTAVVRSQAEPMLASLPGQHGSLTATEQLVPLLVGP